MKRSSLSSIPLSGMTSFVCPLAKSTLAPGCMARASSRRCRKRQKRRSRMQDRLQTGDRRAVENRCIREGGGTDPEGSLAQGKEHNLRIVGIVKAGKLQEASGATWKRHGRRNTRFPRRTGFTTEQLRPAEPPARPSRGALPCSSQEAQPLPYRIMRLWNARQLSLLWCRLLLVNTENTFSPGR